MRALTEVETKTFFSKLANYIGVPPTTPEDGSADDRHVFRLHAPQVYHPRLPIANLATSIARPNILSLGTCIGKFTKTGKFRPLQP
jgi:60S ribosome subunit biogenesis protein NIP7